jgi:hypothetical protein
MNDFQLFTLIANMFLMTGIITEKSLGFIMAVLFAFISIIVLLFK